ncbi:MAG TPA: CAP domain-containing protein [Polyangiaceae bacterium]
MVALASGACGSGNDSDESETAGGTHTMGDVTTEMGGMGGTSAVTSATTGLASSTSASSTSAMSTTSATSMAATNAAASGTTGVTGFGDTAGPGPGGAGFGGEGLGGQGAGGTATTSSAGGTEPGETGVFEGTVAAHNEARADVDVFPPLPELVWSDDLAEMAQDWANTLVDETNCGNIFHRPNGMYGENIALQGSFGGGSASFTGPDAVAGWVAEIDCYTYGTIGQTEQCDPGCIADLNSSGCGHYTQVVWDSTTAVGCGYGTCQDDTFTIEVIVCNYDPPGNYIGETPY